MVKGISKQVIVVHSPDPKLFEQAIFILKESAVGQEGLTDAALLKEANRLIREPSQRHKRKLRYYGPVWAMGGALITGAIWLASVLL